MSFAGHVYDMIRRDKENREMRKRNAENRKDRFSKNVFKGKVDYSRVSLSELEEVTKNTKEKTGKDNEIIGRNMLIFLLVGIITGIICVLVLRKMGIL